MCIYTLAHIHWENHDVINTSRYAHKVIPQLVPVLSELSEQLDNIEWAAQVSVFDTQIVSHFVFVALECLILVNSLEVNETVTMIHVLKSWFFLNKTLSM